MTTIKRIRKIERAATFASFHAEKDAPDLFEFGKRNLVYGFNGCGKTVLSRIFGYLGSGTPPEALPDNFAFEFNLSDGSGVRRDRGREALANRVCVYNQDFIDQSFNWREGTADPVQLGAAQVEDVKQLEELDKAVDQAEKAHRPLKDRQTAARGALDTFCRQTAKVIEETARLPRRSFQADSLKRAYDQRTYSDADRLSDAAAEAARAVVYESNPPRTLTVPDVEVFDLDNFLREELLPVLSAIATQGDLPALEAHLDQREWVKQGFEYHRSHGLERCLLCDNRLAPERLAELAAYFSDAINRISERTSDALETLEAADTQLAKMADAFPAAEQTTPQVRAEYAASLDHLKALTARRGDYIGPIFDVLKSKLRAPASELAFEDSLRAERTEWICDLQATLEKALEHIRKHNEIAERFSEEQDRERKALKAHLLAEHQAEYAELVAAERKASEAERIEAENLAKVKRDLDDLRAKLRDHAAAAGPINQAVANFLRHKQISITPVDTGYLLKRADGSPIKHLSEGEKTAITFCYFLATLKADNRKLENLIVVVDDPISSLDTRALHYMAALIKSELTEIAQLFIFTHNLPFMTEMRKWIAPAKVIREASEAKREQPQRVIPIPLYQIHIRQGSDGVTRTAVLDNMHTLVRDYESEYHFLYSVIYTFAKQEHPTAEPIYLLPNAMRKVLETFLSFKVPGAQNLTSALGGVSGSVEDKVALEAVSRLLETESHADSLSPLIEPAHETLEEAHDAARALLTVIAQLDENHKKAMDRLAQRNPALG